MRIEVTDLGPDALHLLIGDVVTPEPIAFVSTVGRDRVYNAAPFSFVSPICVKPPILCLSLGLRQGEKKDTVRNIEFSRDFVVNIVDEDLIDRAVRAAASYPHGVSEFEAVGLTAVAGERVKSPRIAESPVNLECKVLKILKLGEGSNQRSIVFGEVVLMHVRDELWIDGSIPQARLKPIGRLGRSLYCRTHDTFERKTPPLPGA